MLLLLLVLAVFLIPTFLQMRRQRRHFSEIKQVQSNLAVGDRVITSSGTHGTVVAVRTAQIDLEIAPGTVTTWERMAVVRHATTENTNVDEDNSQPSDEAEK